MLNPLMKLLRTKAEGETLDYKEALHLSSDSEKEELARDLAAFANTKGGQIVFGVEDIRTVGNVREFDIESVLQDFAIDDRQKLHAENLVRTLIKPVPTFDVNVVRIKGKALTVFKIKEGQGDLCDLGGVTYIRGVAGKRVAEPSEKTQILSRRRKGK
jgi:predicted HTH transcriptional regulator